jgi:uracil phosphoribosyltransferase
MLNIINHPIINTKLSRMRNQDTDSSDFKRNLTELSQFMAYEVTKDFKTVPFPIKTPITTTTGCKLKDKVVLVPILRAGLGMMDGFSAMMPSAPIGFIGLYRNEKTLQPVEYYVKMPNIIAGSNVLILDPMLATGNSLIAAIKVVQKYKPKSIKLVSIVAAPVGIKAVQKAFPNIDIYTAAVDKKLNDIGYIVPGLGDAGDRIFGTK